jgi:putative chitobiose transport system permease protein
MRKSNIVFLAYAFLAPALILMAVFTFYPVVYGSWLGFTDYSQKNLSGEIPANFVGLENFKTVFTDELFRTGIWNSLKYLLVVPVLQLASLGVAVLVNRQLPAITFFRAAYYVPVITSISLASVMWDWVYSKDGVLNWGIHFLYGIGNFFAGLFGVKLEFQAFGWLNNPDTAIWAIMLVTFWRGFGYYMVLYLGGLQAIPLELEEAARLDGATPSQTFWRVTVPLMRPTILLCSLLSTLAAIRVLEEIIVFTNGGPLNSTYTALMYVYSKAFGSKFDFGTASAAGLLIAVVGFFLSYLNFKLTQEAPDKQRKA